MNQRIYELIRLSAVPTDQAEDYAESKGLIEPAEKLDVAKFVKLIVLECAGIVNSLEQYEGQGDCSTAEYIKEHFGVEE